MTRPLGRPASAWEAATSCDQSLWRDELEATAGFHHLPFTLMHAAMMEITEGKQVGQIARSTSGPELDVMWVRPVDRPITTRKPAVFVSSPEGSAVRGRGRPRRPTDIDHL